MQQAVAIVDDFVRGSKSSLVATANAEMVMLAQQDQDLFAILNSAELVLADGAGVVWAARRLAAGVPERVAGYDLTQELLKHAATTGYKVFWLGAAPGVAEAAAAKAAAKYPGLHTVGTHDGYFDYDDDNIRRLIRESQTDILLCALGVPKQEKWLSQYRDELGAKVLIGVGGTFDVMAGNVKRAPLWMQRAGLEWSYRLLRQPSRIVRMMALPRFVARVMIAAWTSH
jgi:N-acetylglucosaminyldiphosphoundecaprenol N-acetyl-beta-D-mannosaminyltransferase